MSLKEKQVDTVSSFCSGHDVFVSLPTGFGKSIILLIGLEVMIDKLFVHHVRHVFSSLFVLLQNYRDVITSTLSVVISQLFSPQINISKISVQARTKKVWELHQTPFSPPTYKNEESGLATRDYFIPAALYDPVINQAISLPHTPTR